MDDQTTTDGAPAGRALRRRPQVVAGFVVSAAALAAIVSLTVGPASPPSVAEPGPATSSPAPAGSPVSAEPSPVAPPQASEPLHITYPVVGMDQDVQPLTPQDQGSQTLTPPMTTDAYWLAPYGSPGSADTTYIVGHSWEGRDSAFNHLSSNAKPGDQITVTTAGGPVTYSVTTVSTEDKDTLKDSSIWNTVPNRLILVSCYTADLRGTNIIVTADLAPAG